MYRAICLLTTATSLLGSTQARTERPLGRGVEPTRSGQIGVNPVTAEPASDYLSLVGPNTQYYQSDGSRTKWIGVNTEYLTEIYATMTVNNVPTTVTTGLPIALVTATDAASGLGVGDVSVALSPAILDVLNSIAAEVAETCAGKKRQACDINLEFGTAVNREMAAGGRLDFNFDFIQVPTLTAGDVAAVVDAVTVAGGAPVGGMLGVYVFLYIIAQENANGGKPTIPPVANIPATMNNPSKTKDPPSSTSSGCPPDAPTGKNRPICPSDDCKGPNDGGKDQDRRCQEGKWKNCPCVREVNAIAQQRPGWWLDNQQSILQWIVDHDDESEQPWCLYGASSKGDKIPAEYCQCGDKYESTFSVASSTASSYLPCPYTVAPGPTITFQATTPPTANPLQCNGPSDNNKWKYLNVTLSAAEDFCEWVTINPNGPDLQGDSFEKNYYDKIKYPDGPFREDAKFIFRVEKTGCPGQGPLGLIPRDECTSALHDVINGCNGDGNDQVFGGNNVLNCIKYTAIS
ncbi:hypothetical protein BDV96DRAFT_634945 [Lophiotrema nucula]|uniref:Uncharacterized protein n=1 Tax=Lophiotrema nucula TaxID=690887 RepID=A0A6A5YVK9_9PLEO|nr:hypothetical protein BDV96DRAFT_634945 [Lophiotrema nucula]